MARYSFSELTEVLGGKTKVMIISGIVAGTFLFGGAISTVARLAVMSKTSDVMSTSASEMSPELQLVGTYYGYNGSVLILKSDGKADYYYKDLSDVQHNNSWSLQDDEIKLELDWMFCTAVGTIESGTDSFVLVGDTDLDDLLWDDERFDKILDSSSSMTKEECNAFIDEQEKGTENASASASDVAVGTNNAAEYTSSFDAEELDVTFVDCFGVSLPIPDRLLDSATSNEYSVFYYDNNSGLALGCVPVDTAIDHDYLDELGNDFLEGFMSSFGSGSVNSQTDVLIGGHPAIEYSAVALSSYNSTYTVKNLIVDYSDEGYVFIVFTVYNSLNSSMLDYYHYLISVLQTSDISNIDSTVDISAPTSTSDSSSVRETLDAYEEFMNDYVSFMQTYNSASPDQMLQMLDDYMDLMTEYTEFMESIDNLDTSSMSADDYAYYIEVTTRVSQNLLSLYS